MKQFNIFESTKPGSCNEDRYARIKNYNLPILNYMYMGDCDTMIKCLESGIDAFTDRYCYVKKQYVKTFTIEFDHIRQKYNKKSTNAHSIDKHKKLAPSQIFRGFELDIIKNRFKLIEMMCIWPLSTQMHSYKTNSSQYGDIVLSDISTSKWPWHLKSRSNFNQFCNKFDLQLQYDTFIDQLCDINVPNIPILYQREANKLFTFDKFKYMFNQWGVV